MEVHSEDFDEASAVASHNEMLESILAPFKASMEDGSLEKLGGLIILVIFVSALVVMVYSSLTLLKAKRVGIVPAIYYSIFLVPVGRRLLQEALAMHN